MDPSNFKEHCTDLQKKHYLNRKALSFLNVDKEKIAEIEAKVRQVYEK